MFWFYLLAVIPVIVTASGIFFISSALKKYPKGTLVGTSQAEEIYYVIAIGALSVLFIVIDKTRPMDNTIKLLYCIILLALSVCAFIAIYSKVLLLEDKAVLFAPFKATEYQLNEITRLEENKHGYIAFVGDKKLFSFSKKDKNAQRILELLNNKDTLDRAEQ